MKKFVSMLLALVMVFALCACGSKTEGGDKAESKIKVGFICLHDENSTYDKNFIDAAKAACKNAGLSEDQYIIKTNIPEGQECYNAAAELVDAGCNVVFADSFGHEDFMIQAAKEFKDVQFCHATGTKAHTEKLSNYHNAFASIYEGRYLAGVAAGMKLNEMIEAGEFTADQAKMGYVGAFTYAEVISGYTSFYLGAKSVCPTVTMDVTFTGSWYDEALEKEAANKLIAGGPMMGMAQASADFPVAKGTGAVLAFAANENKVSEDPTCIRCGRCVEACPMHLEPLYLYLYVQKNRIEDLEAAHVMDCIECGACSYICPGRLHLTHSFKVGKQKVKEAAAKAKAAAEAAKAAEEAKKEA